MEQRTARSVAAGRASATGARAGGLGAGATLGVTRGGLAAAAVLELVTDRDVREAGMVVADDGVERVGRHRLALAIVRRERDRRW